MGKTGYKPSARIVDHRQILENLPVITMRLSYENRHWHTWYISKNIEQYGFSWDAFMQEAISWVDLVHVDDRVLALNQAHDYLIRGLDEFRLQYRIQSPRGETFWVSEYSHVNRDDQGNPLSVDSMLITFPDDKLNRDLINEHVRRQAVLNDILLSLHEADLDQALEIILQRVGAYLDTSRVLLFADSPDHKTCQVVREWLNKGITSIKDIDYAITYSIRMSEIYQALQQAGMLLVDAGRIPENCREEFSSEGVLASAIFAVYQQGAHYGFVCFDDCVIERVWDEDTVSFLKIISSLISTLLMRIHGDEQLKFSQNTCEAVLDNVDSYIYATNPQNDEIIFANRVFRKVFGADCIGQDSHSYLQLRTAVNDEKTDHSPAVEGRMYEAYLAKTGQWLAVSRELVPWVDGRTVFLNNCYDITAKKQFEDNITQLAFQDHLTGLPNRYRCDIDLENCLERARLTGQAGYVFFIDLDDFKIVNDSCGHAYGDEVLISFAAYLRKFYNGDNFVYRFGGDEFVIIINNGSREIAEDFLNTMMKRARKPWKAKDREFHCSLSVGVVEFSSQGNDDVTSILRKADIAMYQAKYAGKNNYFYYTEGLDSAAIKRSEMEKLLRGAMEDDFQGFEIHYQPYYRSKDQSFLGAEALLRMREPGGRLLLPEQFLPLAEYLGLIVPLGEYVLNKAALQCKTLNEAGWPDFTITVNLSVQQFKQKNIIGQLENSMREVGVKPENMIIAINEKVALVERERMLRLCSRLRKQGVIIALDDFGSGSSSFINMRNLPVDIIKVSSQYIETIEDEYTGYFIKMVTELCHFTGKQVCISGVETKNQLTFCQKTGVDMIQGYLLHHPVQAGLLYEALAAGAV